MSVELEKGFKAKTGNNRGGVGSKIKFEKLWEGIVGAKVEAGQINASEEGMIRHDGVKETVKGRVRGGGGGDGIRKSSQLLPTRCSTHPTIDIGGQVTMVAGAEKSGGRPLLFHHVVQIRGGGGGKVRRGQGACRLNELDQLINSPFPLRHWAL